MFNVNFKMFRFFIITFRKYRYIWSKNDVISLVRKYNCTSGLGLVLGLGLELGLVLGLELDLELG